MLVPENPYLSLSWSLLDVCYMWLSIFWEGSHMVRWVWLNHHVQPVITFSSWLWRVSYAEDARNWSIYLPETRLVLTENALSWAVSSYQLWGTQFEGDDIRRPSRAESVMCQPTKFGATTDNSICLGKGHWWWILTIGLLSSRPHSAYHVSRNA